MADGLAHETAQTPQKSTTKPTAAPWDRRRLAGQQHSPPPPTMRQPKRQPPGPPVSTLARRALGQQKLPKNTNRPRPQEPQPSAPTTQQSAIRDMPPPSAFSAPLREIPTPSYSHKEADRLSLDSPWLMATRTMPRKRLKNPPPNPRRHPGTAGVSPASSTARPGKPCDNQNGSPGTPRDRQFPHWLDAH